MNLEGQDDKVLIERYNAGDRTALTLLVQKWHKTFCQKAFWVLRDKELAKDVAQECWIIIIKKLNTLNNAESFKGWALRIVYTKSIDAYKTRAKQSRVLDNTDHATYAEPRAIEGRVKLQKELFKAIQDLSKDKQDIIRLFYVEQYSLNEISAVLQIPIGTVKSRLFKAREKLKLILKS